jgi:hypothetical protein
MARGMTRISLAVGAGVLCALMTAGVAEAAPSGQSSATAPASQSTAKARPAPTAGGVAPTSAKTGKAGASGGVSTQHLDGSCNLYADGTGDLCMWYLSGFSGSYVDFYFGDDNLWDNVFLSPGAGQGSVVANNAESAWNYDTIYTAWVCDYTYQQGACGYVLPWSGGNFVYPWFNGVESLHWS